VCSVGGVRVREIMSAPPVTLDRTDTLAFAEELMNVERIRHLPVVDGDVLLGLISHSDVLAASISTLSAPSQEDDLELKRKVQVGAVMHGVVETTTPEAPADKAADTLLAHQIGCLPVIDERHHLIGIVTSTDFVRMARDLLAGGKPPARPPRARAGHPAHPRRARGA
jgi:CBS domain-containing membrane protein